MKKNLLAIIFGLAIIFTVYNFKEDPDFLRAEVGNGYRVAACPTHHHMLPALDRGDFQTTRASSTGESLKMMKEGEVDLVISGRNLKPGEPELESLKLAEGYSFLAEEGFSITEDEMEEYNFYTDLDKDSVINDFLSITKENLTQVEDVYEKSDDGIVVTSFENTDYEKAEIVNIYDGFGRRVEKTRRPTLFFREENRDKAEEIINLIKK